MRRVAWHSLWLLVPLNLGCEGREVSVFDVPSKLATGGSAGSSGAAGTNVGGDAAGLNSPAGGLGGNAGTAGAAGGGGAGGSSGDTYQVSGGAAGAAGSGGAAPLPCVADTDCSPGWVCDKPGCQAPSGLCVPWPAICDPSPKPVCGCDGVTYWNDCIRLQSPSHAQLQGPDQCRATACACEVGSDCHVPYASCAHLMAPGEMCGHGMGACWVLPPTCAPSADSKMWRECKPPDAGPAGPCLDTCSAIATEHPYAELHRGDTCN
jgi:hypothetical protein